MKFNFDATGIGSVPFKEPSSALSLIFENFKSIPFWPQLPKRSFLESMYAQYSEGLPGLVIDDARKTIHIDTARAAQEIEPAYAKYLEGDIEYFKISKDHAEGLYAFLAEFGARAKDIRCVKGHITGPISFALTVTNENKQSIMYDRDTFEVLTKVLCMKVRWQIRELKKLFPSVMIFVDEPYLVSIGSSFVNINIEDAFSKLDEVIASIKEEGALAGLHCCGNTDWPLLLKRDLDILNFDAYAFTKELLLYGAELKAFLARGSTIAWGIAPSSEAIYNESAESLIKKLSEGLKALVGKGIPVEKISSIVTPSCGVGTLNNAAARKVFETLRLVSATLQK
ncbi:MAG: hypothetical protein NTY76_07965 [Candidatus Omnitrophica bacterium]|nr:hypothetical protein [Candidatus Omnitrophota bacterium]